MAFRSSSYICCVYTCIAIRIRIVPDNIFDFYRSREITGSYSAYAYNGLTHRLYRIMKQLLWEYLILSKLGIQQRKLRRRGAFVL